MQKGSGRKRVCELQLNKDADTKDIGRYQIYLPIERDVEIARNLVREGQAHTERHISRYAAHNAGTHNAQGGTRKLGQMYYILPVLC